MEGKTHRKPENTHVNTEGEKDRDNQSQRVRRAGSLQARGFSFTVSTDSFKTLLRCFFITDLAAGDSLCFSIFQVFHFLSVDFSH